MDGTVLGEVLSSTTAVSMVVLLVRQELKGISYSCYIGVETLL